MLRAFPGEPMVADPSYRAAMAQSAHEAVRARWDMHPVHGDLVAFGSGTGLEQCSALGALLADPMAVIAPLLDDLMRVMRTHPDGHMPLRFVRTAHFTALLLGASGRAKLSLLTYEPHAPGVAAATFTHGERIEHVLRGRADATLLALDRLDEAGRAVFARMRCQLVPGARFITDCARQTLMVDPPSRPVTVLRLARAAARPDPMRQFRLSDGALIHQAAGDCDASRRELMAVLLARLAPERAPRVLAGLTQGGPDHLRWQALRECLALDTARGFAALSRLADAPGDTLQSHAAALRTDLLAQHPQLHALMKRAPCPA